MSDQREMKVKCLLSKRVWRLDSNTEVQLGIKYSLLEGLWLRGPDELRAQGHALAQPAGEIASVLFH